jgi:hypothetical protein
MFLVDPKVFRFVVKEVKAIFLGVQRGWCRESIQDVEIEQCWICAVLWQPFWKWRLVEIFQCQESIRDIIIYPHMKCRWNRLKMAATIPQKFNTVRFER